MRMTTAYFAGAATIVVAIAAGLGGGMVIADIASPQGTEPSRVERHVAAKAQPAPAAPASPSSASTEPVSYLAATQAAAINPVTVSPAPQPQPSQPAVATQAAAQPAAEPVHDAAPPAQPAPNPPLSTQAQREPSASSGDATAKVRGSDSKRDLRRAEDRRKSERRQQWAERRSQQQRDDELRDVERSVREATEQPHVFTADPVKINTPRIPLFGGDDDED